MDIITRAEAQAQGLKTYFEAKTCKRGHVAPYRVNPNACTECIKLAARKPPAELQTCEHCEGQFRPRVTVRKVRFCSEQCNHSHNNAQRSLRRAAVKQEHDALMQWLPGYLPRAKASELGLRTYFVGHRCPRGHVAPHLVAGGCSVCATVSSREWHRKARAANLEHYKSRERARIRPRTEELRSKEAMRREINRDRTRQWSRQYQSKRRRIDPQYRLRCALSGRVGTALKKQYGAKAHKTMELVGCSIPALMAHLEALFQPGMTWDNHAIDGWHIDHIRPCTSFDLTDPEQQRQCFHYTNLQPLWAFDNISKSDKWEPATMGA